MKRTFLAALLALLSMVVLRSQSNAASAISSVNLNNSRTFDNRYDGVKGSPFILDDWHEAILFLGKDQTLRISHLNFDRHSNVLCFKEDPGSEIKVISKFKVPYFKVLTPEGDSLCFFRERDPAGSDQIYLEEVYRGKCLLCLDHAKKFKAADYEQVYSLDRRNDEFTDQPVYYIRLQEGAPFIALKKNKKNTALIFNDKREEMLRYLKAEKTNPGNREELIALVKYYESLPE